MMESSLSNEPEGSELKTSGDSELSTLPQSQRSSPEERDHLQVFLRIRPFTSAERSNGESLDCVTIESPSSVLLKSPCLSAILSVDKSLPHTGQRFQFSQVYGPETTQREMFEGTVKDLVKNVLGGGNSLVFTYGVTNAGKTFTFLGPDADAGILPRSLDLIFSSIDEQVFTGTNIKPHRCREFTRLSREQQVEEAMFKRSLLRQLKESDRSNVSLLNSTNKTLNEGVSVLGTTVAAEDKISLQVETHTKFSVWVSFCEIYNENIHDLLEVASSGAPRRTALRLSQDVKGNAFVKDLHWVQVSSAEEAYSVMKLGKKNQSFSSTRLNQVSSRSHSIFSIRILKIDDVGTQRVHTVSELCLCDLAGSERCAKTQNKGERLKEAGNINTSLLILGKCINALRHNQQAKLLQHVPFRESKLTHYLQGFFCGRGKACMIVNVNQCASMYDETLNVLKFSAVAQKVVVLSSRPLPAKPQRSASDSGAERKAPCGRSSLMDWESSLEDVKEDADNEYEEETSLMEETVEETGNEDDEDDDDDKILISKQTHQKQVALLKQLQLQLKVERAEGLLIETRVREETSREFCDLFSDMQTDFNERLVREREILEERAERRLEIFKNLFEKMTEAGKCLDPQDMDKSLDPYSSDLTGINKAAEAACECLGSGEVGAVEELQRKVLELHELKKKQAEDLRRAAQGGSSRVERERSPGRDQLQEALAAREDVPSAVEYLTLGKEEEALAPSEGGSKAREDAIVVVETARSLLETERRKTSRLEEERERKQQQVDALQQEVLDLSSKVESVERQVTRERDRAERALVQLDEHSTLLQVKTCQIHTLTLEAQNLKLELQTSTDSVGHQLRDELSALRKNLADEKDKHENERIQRRELERELQQVKERLERTQQLEQINEKLRQQHEAAARRAEELRKKLQEQEVMSQQTLDELKSKLERQERSSKEDGDELRAKLEEQKQASEKQLEEKLREQEASKKHLEEKLREQEASEKQLEEKLREQEASEKQLEEKLREQEASEKQLEEKLREQEASKKHLEEKLREQEASEKQLEEKLREQEASKKQLEEKQREQEASEKQLEEKLREQEASKKQLEEKLREQEASEKQLEEKQREQEASEKHLEEKLREQEASEKQLEKKLREQEASEKQLEEKLREQEASEKQLEELKRKLSEQQETNEKLSDDLKLKTAELEEAWQKVRGSSCSEDEVKRLNSELQTELAALREQLSNVEEEKESSSEAKAQLASSETAQASAELQKKLLEKEAEVAALQKSLQEAVDQREEEEIQAVQEARRREAERRRELLAVAHEAIAQKDEELEKKSGDIDRLKENAKLDSEKVARLGLELQRKEDEASDLREKLADYKKQVQQVQKEISAMREEEKVSRQKLTEAEKTKKQLQSDVANRDRTIQQLKLEQSCDTKTDQTLQLYQKSCKELEAKERVIEDMRLALTEQEETQVQMEDDLEQKLSLIQQLSDVVEKLKADGGADAQCRVDSSSHDRDVKQAQQEAAQAQEKLKLCADKHQAERKKWLEEKLSLIGQAKEAEDKRNQEMRKFAEDRERYARQQSQMVALSAELTEKDQAMETWRKERDTLVEALGVQLQKLLSSQAEKDKLIQKLRHNATQPPPECGGAGNGGVEPQAALSEREAGVQRQEEEEEELDPVRQVDTPPQEESSSSPAPPAGKPQRETTSRKSEGRGDTRASVSSQGSAGFPSVLDSSEISTENGRTRRFPRPEMEISFSPLQPNRMALRRQGEESAVTVKITRSARKRKSGEMDKSHIFRRSKRRPPRQEEVEAENRRNTRTKVTSKLTPHREESSSPAGRHNSRSSIRSRKEGALQKIGDFLHSSPTLLGTKAKKMMSLVSGRLDADSPASSSSSSSSSLSLRSKKNKKTLYRPEISSPMDMPSHPIISQDPVERESDHQIIRRRLRSRMMK